MLVLFETAAGFAVFKVLKESKLEKADLFEDFATPEKASKIVKLKAFLKFDDTTEALAAAAALTEGKIDKQLKGFLKKLASSDVQEQLAVADSKLGNAIKEKFSFKCIYGSQVQELMRGIRAQLDSLVSVSSKDRTAMSLGLAHSLSRYKLKFSPDKVDTMIVQAISLLDDLDKELNNYVMRCREWYGWHFPEMGKLVQENLVFAKLVLRIGDRRNCSGVDLSELVPEELEQELKENAEISMGTEVSPEDIMNIKYMCDQIVEMTQYRAQLFDYLKNRMMAIAPNLTVLVGELVGARLIAHAGSLLNLSKQPSSTVQILGAEKALFRALKTKHDTPKYGLIYHAALITQSNAKHKGKVSRMLAAKAALAIRVDALGEDGNKELGIEHRAKVEARLRQLSENQVRQVSGTGRQQAKWEKLETKSEVRVYDTAEDSTIPTDRKRKLSDGCQTQTGKKIKSEPTTPESKKKKKKKKKSDLESSSTVHKSEKMKKKKKKSDGDDASPALSGKKKKKIKHESD